MAMKISKIDALSTTFTRPELRFEQQGLTSFSGLVLFDKSVNDTKCKAEGTAVGFNLISSLHWADSENGSPRPVSTVRISDRITHLKTAALYMRRVGAVRNQISVSFKQCLIKIMNQVINMFYTDGQTQEVLWHTGFRWLYAVAMLNQRFDTAQ